MSSQASFALRARNPDVLTCIANLSNDEVFTPPEFVNRILDALTAAWAATNGGANMWADKTIKFLDPCTKSGVFLREITSRLTAGLAHEIPDLETRVNHILTNQVFGIGITHLTSLLARRSVYCSKHATGTHSIAKSFSNSDGNIWFKRLNHTWNGEHCKYCGAGKSVFERHGERETHAYAFIHTDEIALRIAELFGDDVKFDVIIGNPPYQLASDGGTRDMPIYQLFVEQAKKLEPRFLTMIIPSRWMASGLGLNDFRKAVLSDRRMRQIVDYPDANDVFPGVEVKAGVCYFLWDASHNGDCHVTTIRGNQQIGPIARDLREHDVLVRDARAISILKKVAALGEEPINKILARDKEFGWTSNFDGFHDIKRTGDIPLHYIRKMKRSVGYIKRAEITKSSEMIDTWKVLVPQAFNGGDAIPHQILGKPLIAASPSVCTQSFLFFNVESPKAARSLQSYYATRFFRFLVSLRKITQHATHSTYAWVPMQRWDRIWNDELLYLKYGISAEEAALIESQVREMNLDDEG